MTYLRTFKAASIGMGVRCALEPSGLKGEVVAAYANSCYARFPGGQLVCVGSLSLDDGPLTVRAAFPAGAGMADLGVRTGAIVYRASDCLQVGNGIRLDTSDAAYWTPPVIETYASDETIRCRVDAVVTHLECIAPDQGFGPLVGRSRWLARGETAVTDGQLARLASPRVTQVIGGMLAGSEPEIDAGIAGLVGLGPGLTPSGDDLLGGLMIALWAMAQTNADLRPHLSYAASAIIRIAKSQTTAVSSALLGHAAQGTGSASVHRLVQSLLQSGGSLNPADAALRVSRFGHTSGWDCLAGLLIGVHFGLRMNAPNQEPPIS